MENGYTKETDSSGVTYWRYNGRSHRTDGPAVVRQSGHKEWWYHGVRHRTDGPAIEHSRRIRAWYLNGIQMSKKKFEYITTLKESGLEELI